MTVDLEAFREAVLADAQREARTALDAAERDAQTQLAEARAEAEALLEQARREGREAAARETQRRRVDARQQARTLVLREQRHALERLRDEVLDRLRQQRGTSAYEALVAALAQLARQQLGPEAEIDAAPDAAGVLARNAGRRVDYRLPALADRGIADLGTELARLWK